MTARSSSCSCSSVQDGVEDPMVLDAADAAGAVDGEDGWMDSRSGSGCGSDSGSDSGAVDVGVDGRDGSSRVAV